MYMSRSQTWKRDLVIWASLYLCPTNCQLLATPLATKVIFPSDVIANVTILLSMLVECGEVPVTLHSMCIWAEKNVVH